MKTTKEQVLSAIDQVFCTIRLGDGRVTDKQKRATRAKAEELAIDLLEGNELKEDYTPIITD